MRGNAKESILSMRKIVEDMIMDDKKRSAMRMLERGKLTNEEIAEDLELPLEIVEELADSLQTA